MNKITLYFLLFLTFVSGVNVSAQCDTTRNNGRLDPGEYCDPGEAATSGDEIFFANLSRCSDLPSHDASYRWAGDLECDYTICQLDTSNCYEETIGQQCNECRDCDNIDVPCTFRICTEQCGGRGICTYHGELLLSDDCTECTEVTSCANYNHPQSCNNDVCQTIGPTGFTCEWLSSSERCVENRDCQWNCDSVYSDCVNGIKTKTNNFCSLIFGDPVECNPNNPAYTFPDTLACQYPEKDFPVFTWMNIIVSVFLLIGYYVILRKRF